MLKISKLPPPHTAVMIICDEKTAKWIQWMVKIVREAYMKPWMIEINSTFVAELGPPPKETELPHYSGV